MQRYVYADNAATTPVSKEVVDAMMPYLTEEYGNPSSTYMLGQRAAQALEAAREKVAKAINCSTVSEIRVVALLSK